MRIEKAHSLQIDSMVKNAVKPGLPSEEKRMKDSSVNDRDAANSTKTTGDKPEYNYRKIELSVHEKTGDIMIKVYDTETNEVIREIPPEKIKDMVANMLERAGLLVDERA